MPVKLQPGSPALTSRRASTSAFIPIFTALHQRIRFLLISNFEKLQFLCDRLYIKTLVSVCFGKSPISLNNSWPPSTLGVGTSPSTPGLRDCVPPALAIHLLGHICSWWFCHPVDCASVWGSTPDCLNLFCLEFTFAQKEGLGLCFSCAFACQKTPISRGHFNMEPELPHQKNVKAGNITFALGPTTLCPKEPFAKIL